MTEFKEFNKYSFITYDDLEKDFYIHRILRKEILKTIPLDRAKELNREILSYYSDKVSVHAENKSVLEIFYHAKECMCAVEFNEWFLSPLSENIVSPFDILKQLQKRGEQSVLMHIFNYTLEKYETSDMLINFINIYIDTVHLGGEYEKAVNICNNYLNKYKKEEIANDKQLLKMNIRKLLKNI